MRICCSDSLEEPAEPIFTSRFNASIDKDEFMYTANHLPFCLREARSVTPINGLVLLVDREHLNEVQYRSGNLALAGTRREDQVMSASVCVLKT